MTGAASEGDFHAALGMNSVLGGPCIWFCRNNGYVDAHQYKLTPVLQSLHPSSINMQETV